MRYTTRGDVTELMAPPYDVISPERRDELARQHAHNAVHLDLPVDEGDLDRYEAACQRLHRWLDEQVLATDAEPAFYLYRMDYTTVLGQPAQTTGVIGALELSTPGHRRRAPARADHAEGQERPAPDAPVLPVESLAHLGAVARLGSHRPPPDRRRARHPLDRFGRRRASSLVGDRPGHPAGDPVRHRAPRRC